MYTLTKLVLNQDRSDDIVHEVIPHTDLVAVAMMEVDGKLRPVREEDLQQMANSFEISYSDPKKPADAGFFVLRKCYAAKTCAIMY